MSTQSLFGEGDAVVQKKLKLGTYERIRKETQKDVSDSRKRFITVNPENKNLTGMNVVDLFCGAGGMSLGMHQAGGTLIGGVEVSEIASNTHRQNFPTCRTLNGDITQVQPEELSQGKQINLVVGGPPCQGFSVAGRRDPNDPRNRLFLEFVRFVKCLNPEYFVMENVPGILTMQQGAVKKAIMQSFEEIGFNTSVCVLEAAEYGVPQFRSRAFFIGNRVGGLNFFPAPLKSPESFATIEDAIADLPSWQTIPELNHEWTKHSPNFTQRISRVRPGDSLYATFADAYKRQHLGRPSMTIKENHGGTHIHPILDRVISAREMARLQTFPDEFIFYGSMKKAMWQIGNAVPPLLARMVANAVGYSMNNNNLLQIKNQNHLPQGCGTGSLLREFDQQTLF
jgi:DNA (cytosine-5)-methyltransferase 1